MRLSPALLAVLPLAVAAVALACPRSGTAQASPNGDPAPASEPAGGSTERHPVVVELFTSEGCSSCPSADVLLSRISRDQSVAGAEVYALELHVDYWNYLGWADPFSSAAFTSRQRTYADAFGQRGVYTPQLVVGGAADVLGSNEPGARSAIAAAARQSAARVDVTRSGDRLTITVTDLDDRGGSSDVWVAVTEAGLSTAVPRGENAGATLAHAPVVRSLDRVATIAPGTITLKDVPLTLKPEWRRQGLRAVAFVQRRSLRIVGAGAVSLR